MNQENETNELFEALCYGTISPSDHARLCELLQSSPQIRQSFYRHLELDLRLSRWSGIEENSNLVVELQDDFDQQFNSPKPTADLGKNWLLIAAAMSAVLLIGIFLSLPKGENNVQGSGQDVIGAGVAMLIQSADCVWQTDYQPRFNGQQILPDEIRLEKGTAEFLFDTGAFLVIDGPSRISIQSGSEAMLYEGSVVLNCDNMIEEFALQTPNATLIDEGTEYGVVVDPKRAATEIHVFEGKVRVETSTGEDDENTSKDLVSMGSASRIDSAGAMSLPLESQRFVRRIPSDRLPRISPPQELFAQEDFNYPGPELDVANDDKGWAGPWRRDVVKFEPSKSKIVPNKSLFSPALDRKGAGGHLLQDGRGSALRPLSHPIRMDLDAEYYVSFLVKKSRESARGVTQYGSLSLRPSSQENFIDEKLLFGVSSENDIIMIHNGDQKLTKPTLAIDETYCFVAKIVARKSMPDQIMLQVYNPQEKVGESQPSKWTCESLPQENSTVYRNLFLYVGGDATFEFDQIRIGSTWRSVTSNQ